ncbi:uncharacterized protein PHACADRAFT_254080 [Phanerochaete carnosa HHB-10118-sp]|uniref:Uncharacterized protein n=1 Tax=Phanerochaete carnosa (strain HHB-10118-sp) TaxID=650164 RepID=K5VYW0_PHACS|nr:uncharacterized protein PHACADRAFT_254080 [Phanerochaete carnosa HHB-10118-sp]EKM56768.1 hypothetical protein PHACADRAFT_254080 [Phanerochaete carnosa HHB-10118-sp]
MSYGTPYLISLGLSKSAVAMVFLAGPISGLVVQPLIGVLADHSKSRFGRRRPYMIGGVAICMSAMLLLGFTRPFATIFTPTGSAANQVLTIWLAILAIFTIDFSINAVQAVDRALLVDTLPPSDQPDGNAWAARMLGFGSVAGYFVGNVDMTKVFPFLGDTELEVLSVIGSFLLVLTHCATAYSVKEKVVISTKQTDKGLRKEFKEIWTNIRTLPTVIRQICIIQFFAWIGWFPLLFNTTEFIAELHRRSHPNMDYDAAMEEGTRLGSRAMFYNSILALTANLFMPFFVAEAKSRLRMQNKFKMAGQSVWVRWFNKLKMHLASLWAASHLLFAICMLATFFYSSVWGATFFTTLAGFSWAITQWAPFALLAEAILEDDTEIEDANSIVLDDTRSRRLSGRGGGEEYERQFLVGNDEDEEREGLEDEVQSFRSSVSMDTEQERAKAELFMNNASARRSHLNVNDASSSRLSLHADYEESIPKEKKGGGLAAKAGIILGIHNIFVVIPQFVITGISSIIFALTSSGEVEDHNPSDLATNGTVVELMSREGPTVRTGGPDSYAYVFRLGGLAAVVAFVLTVKLSRHLQHQQHSH